MGLCERNVAGLSMQGNMGGNQEKKKSQQRLERTRDARCLLADGGER